MKCFNFMLIAVAAVLCVGCATVDAGRKYEGRKVKTAFFVDNGSRGGGVIQIARILNNSPQVDVTMVNGKDLREGKLEQFDLIVMPGGSSRLQMQMMGEKGVEALRDFIRKGGSYLGVCAGCHITLNRPERARIFPYKYNKSAVGAKADVHIDISKNGAKILDIPHGRYIVRYSHGPVMIEDKWSEGKCETLAIYKSSVGPANRKNSGFYGTPAMVYGNFGKGKVIATSFHPEYIMETHCIFAGCFYAVTGVKLTPQAPQKIYRPLRVGYCFAGAQSKNQQAMMKEILELDEMPEIALQFGLDMKLCSDVDLLILADADNSNWEEFARKKLDTVVTGFMNRGGRVICVGSSWDKLPEHKNLIRLKLGEPVAGKALEIANEGR